MRNLLLVLLLTLAPACAHPPPTVTPQAALAFRGTQAIKALDLVRDFAVDANKQIPPILSTPTMLNIVKYHRSSIILIHDIPNGWKATVLTGLDELVKDLPANESSKLAPYVGLIKAVIAEVG